MSLIHFRKPLPRLRTRAPGKSRVPGTRPFRIGSGIKKNYITLSVLAM